MSEYRHLIRAARREASVSTSLFLPADIGWNETNWWHADEVSPVCFAARAKVSFIS
jgi:hypothetical protein